MEAVCAGAVTAREHSLLFLLLYNKVKDFSGI